MIFFVTRKGINTMQNMIQINVDGQEVVGAVKNAIGNQVEVEILSPYGGHRASTSVPGSTKNRRPAMYLLRELLEDLYLQCRWDPTC